MGSEVQDREFARHVATRNAWAGIAARMRDPNVPASCVKPDDEAHRASDWRLPATDTLPAGPRQCGVCHPPAVPDHESL